MFCAECQSGYNLAKAQDKARYVRFAVDEQRVPTNQSVRVDASVLLGNGKRFSLTAALTFLTNGGYSHILCSHEQ